LEFLKLITWLGINDTIITTDFGDDRLRGFGVGWVCRVNRPTRHIIGHIGDEGFGVACTLLICCTLHYCATV